MDNSPGFHFRLSPILLVTQQPEWSSNNVNRIVKGTVQWLPQLIKLGMIKLLLLLDPHHAHHAAANSSPAAWHVLLPSGLSSKVTSSERLSLATLGRPPIICYFLHYTRLKLYLQYSFICLSNIYRSTWTITQQDTNCSSVTGLAIKYERAAGLNIYGMPFACLVSLC